MNETHTVPRREEIPVEHTWDLTPMFASDAAWDAEYEQLEALIPGLEALQGTLAGGPAALLHVLTTRDEIYTRMVTLSVYADLRHDSDGSDPAGQALIARAGMLVARISAALAFIEPEILQLPDATLANWVEQTAGLHVYRYDLARLMRQRMHIRSAEVEEVMARFSDITRAPGEFFGTLTDVDLTFPTIMDAEENPVQLSHARYGRLMESHNRRVRHDAFKGYYRSFQSIRNTLATALSAEIRSHVLLARLRGYGSALEAALAPNEIPVEVYHNLIATIEAHLPLLHRYLGLRRRIMGLDELRVYDLYAPLVPEADVKIPYPEASSLVQQACAPLGEHYAAALREAFSHRWIDVYENAGKRNGAYSHGSYTSPPYILLNHQDTLYDAFVLAHELGHSMHSYFTRRTQPAVYGNYTIFVAEVASTLNEGLLADYLLQTRDDLTLKRQLVVRRLEDIRTTLFRQTMFATFELEIHRRVEAGEALTAEGLSTWYRDMVARYHGPEVVLDDEIALEWSRVPHFYYNFYVYQYATGLAASLTLHRQIKSEGQPAVDRYLQFLRGGSSAPSIDLLRAAGVDMTTPEPIVAAMQTFAGLLDELETLF